MLDVNNYTKYKNNERMEFRDMLRQALDFAIATHEPFIETEHFTITNLTYEYISSTHAPQQLQDYYQLVVHDLLEERYLHKGEKDERAMFRRVANSISRDTIDADIIYCLMRLRIFMPATPTLMNSGRDKPMHSSCFVMNPEDAMDSITDYWKYMALVQKHGGGVGAGWDNIRPRGCAVNGTGGVASGWASFFEVCNSINEAVKQGSARSGANAATMRVDHPDIVQFVDYKRDNPQKYQFFNLSLTYTDEQFKKALRNEYMDLVHPAMEPVKIRAGIPLKKMARNAWKNGDPSPYWIDRANRTWNILVKGRLDPWNCPYGIRCSHNPCGEQNLPNFGACNLGSLNFFALYDHKMDILHPKLFDYSTRAAMRFLDAVIDKNWFPDERITMQSKHLRNVGLGFMGLADMFYMMEIDYGSAESVEYAVGLSSKMTEIAWDESGDLAAVLGNAPVFKQQEGFAEVPLRNSDVTCIAPTGSISLISLANNGIEPFFSTHYEKLVYPKGKIDEEKLLDIIPPSIIYFDRIKSRPLTAMKISPTEHIDILAAVSKNVTNAVSKTVNLPNDYSVDDVIDIYRYAFEEGCTSVTIFRDGCRDDLALINKEERSETTKPKDPHSRLAKLSEEDRNMELQKTPFNMDALRDMMEGDESDPIFDEDHEVMSFSSDITYGSGLIVPVLNTALLLKQNREYNNKMLRGACLGCGSNNVRMQDGCVSCNLCSWSMCAS